MGYDVTNTDQYCIDLYCHFVSFCPLRASRIFTSYQRLRDVQGGRLANTVLSCIVIYSHGILGPACFTSYHSMPFGAL